MSVPRPEPAADCTIERDFLKCRLMEKCSFYRPLKFELFCEAFKYRFIDFYRLAPACRRSCPGFPLFDLEDTVCERFVELLAPLTLHYFSLASRDVYHRCLDARGLEFSNVSWFPSSPHVQDVSIDVSNGMKTGNITKFPDALSKFVVCHGSLHVNYDFWVFKNLNCVKKYKFLRVFTFCRESNGRLVEFVSKMMHPGVDHVKVSIDYNVPSCLEKLPEVLGCLQDVKSLYVIVHTLQALPPSNLVEVLEEFAARSTRLELLAFRAGNDIFQLHGGRIRKCVFVDKKWVWSPNSAAVESTGSEFELMDMALDHSLALVSAHCKHGYYTDIDASIDAILSTEAESHSD